jgi:hypothetical protein
VTTTLLVVAVDGGVDGGAVLDRLTLDDEGQIAYRTGHARDMVEAWRQRAGDGVDDGMLLDALTGWSNGYIAIRAAGDADQPADQPADQDDDKAAAGAAGDKGGG